MFSTRFVRGCAVFAAAVLWTVCHCYSSVAAQSSQPTAKKMNVVLILADDFGWTDLACYGSKLYESPNIDQLRTTG